MKMEFHLARAVVEYSSGSLRESGSCTQMRVTGYRHSVDISIVYGFVPSRNGVVKSGKGYVYVSFLKVWDRSFKVGMPGGVCPCQQSHQAYSCDNRVPT